MTVSTILDLQTIYSFSIISSKILTSRKMVCIQNEAIKIFIQKVYIFNISVNVIYNQQNLFVHRIIYNILYCIIITSK